MALFFYGMAILAIIGGLGIAFWRERRKKAIAARWAVWQRRSS